MKEGNEDIRPYMNDAQLHALVLGTLMVTVEHPEDAIKRKGKPTLTELRDKAHDVADRYADDVARVDSMFDECFKMGMLVVLGDEVSLSERGKLMLDINEKKVTIAEVTGDMNIDLDEDQARKVREASPDLPG